VDSEAGRACLADMSWALAFASANREALLVAAASVVHEVSGANPDPSTRIDVHHNFAREEEHLGREVWVHRKGAIAAPAGAAVLIPGSMGTASYVGVGLGEPSSFASASHGAGRVMTRREARERIRVDRLARSMRRVVHDERRAPLLVEEAPDAYRDITEVLEDEVDLVRPVRRLEPMVVLKG
jgi:tRNA-splicing ligase RtcB